MNKGFSVEMAESNNPLADILIPLKNRVGYVSGYPSVSVVPIYFYRYLGIPGLDVSNQNDYYNQLYHLDKTLLKHISGYLKIEHPISMPNNNEIQSVVEKIGRGVPTSTRNLKELIVSQIVQSGALYVFRSSIYNENIKVAFEQVMELYMRNEQQINESKVENFAIKLIVWLKRYVNDLFKESTPTDVPKVLFYGEIKRHEIYFLTLLALIGCDVIFINSDIQKDKPFMDFGNELQFIKRIELPEIQPLEKFPITERAMQKNTVAYNASQEIETVLYGAEVGLFKAWQYDSGYTKPVMLKTTYDELKILWHEVAKVRPEFNVIDEKVYVPNLFAKVNGTHEDLKSYWGDIYSLVDAEHTVLFKQLPISPINYTKQEMFSTAFFFTRDGYLDKEALVKSPLYKLGYLKNTIQDFILSKINELIQENIFLQKADDKLRLKILMTVITMDNELLRLIETFDYTGKVPKIIVYSGERDVMSEEDSILLAFFHLIGADIAIFTPTNYQNLEHWIRPEYFTYHQLPGVHFDMIYQPKSLQEAKNGLKTFFQKFWDWVIGK